MVFWSVNNPNKRKCVHNFFYILNFFAVFSTNYTAANIPSAKGAVTTNKYRYIFYCHNIFFRYRFVEHSKMIIFV